jgi:hypothetical protein
MAMASGILRITAVVALLAACSSAHHQPARANLPLADGSAQSVAKAIDAITTFPSPGSRTASTARRWDAHLRDYRNSAFVNGFGGRSTQNLTYRALRRLNVSIPDMVDRLEDECIFGNESVG